jgi:leucyl aminopeptidase
MNITLLQPDGTLPDSDLVVLIVARSALAKAVGGGRKGRGKQASLLMQLDVSWKGRLIERLLGEREESSKIEVTRLELLGDEVPLSAPVLSVLVLSEEQLSQGAAPLRRAGYTLYQQAKKGRASSVLAVFEGVSLEGRERTVAFLEGVFLSSYHYDRYRSKRTNYGGPTSLVLQPEQQLRDVDISYARTVCEATAFARDMVNTPARECTPSHVVEAARKIAQQGGLDLEVYDRARLESIGAGALLAVAQGSDEPPFLVRLGYASTQKQTPTIALVGKGVTFDSGGLSIKPAQSMEEMKQDMAGAAAVLGAMRALSSLSPPVNVVAFVPTTENMISGRATRPGDVVRARSGKTIEILNTDAEGRLILADALSLACEDRPDLIIDVATLTGAAVVALGKGYAALFSNRDDHAERFIEAGRMVGENFWRMPLVEEYKELLKSPIADLKNTGGKYGGCITGALFLQEFVGAVPWVHLDIASTAFSDSDKEHVKKGGVGFGVRTLVRFIEGFSSAG